METSKPLTYDSLRAILQQMEANKRFQVFLHCPSIRPTDRGVPLKINTFSLFRCAFQVNDTVYRVGSHRQYPVGVEIPQIHQRENDEGGVDADLGKFGLGEPESPDVLTPGDIFISDAIIPMVVGHGPPGDIEEMIAQFSRRLADKERELEELRIREDWDQVYIRGLDHDIDLIRARLQPFLNVRDNRIPPYEIMAQFSVTKNDSKRIELYKKTHKLHEMMKYLLTFLLGHRRDPIHVKDLSFPSAIRILRLPPGIKFKTRQLHVSPNFAMNLNSLKQILEDHQRPLEVFTISNILDRSEDVAHPWVKNAKKLILNCGPYQNTWPQIFANLENSKIHLGNSHAELEEISGVLEAVLRKWASDGRKIGHVFSYEVKYLNTGEILDRLVVVSGEVGGRRIDDGSMKIPTSNDNDLHVTFTPSGAETLPDMGPPGMLKITVVARDQVFVE